MAAPLPPDWRRAIWLTIGLWLFVGLMYLPFIVGRHQAEGALSIALDFSTIFVSMLVAMPLYAVLRATLDRPVWQRGAIVSALVAVASVLQTLFDFQFTRFVASNYEAKWATLPQDLSRFYSALFNYVCVYGVNMALFNLSIARIRWMDQQRDLADARVATQQAQLAALRFQLNPHFLFNTLNAISAMIVTHRNDEAEAMTEKLSAFLRASLASSPTELVSLDEELATVERYLDIEGVRFGDRLRVDVRCPSDAACLAVPSYLLQPLVENAVKYGVSRSRGAVTITIAAEVRDDRLVLAVEDDGSSDGAVATSWGTGTGLANVRQRLTAFYDGAAALAAGPRPDGGYRVELSLPARLAAEC